MIRRLRAWWRKQIFGGHVAICEMCRQATRTIRLCPEGRKLAGQYLDAQLATTRRTSP